MEHFPGSGWEPDCCVIAHTLRSPHSPTALRLVEEVMTVLQLVDQVRTLTDAEQWLIVAGVALLVVVFTGYVGLAAYFVVRAVVGIGRRAAAWRRSGRRPSAFAVITRGGRSTLLQDRQLQA